MANRFSTRIGHRGTAIAAAAALLVAGGAAGAGAIALTRPTVTMAPATPTPIRALDDDGIVTVRGRVAEVYGSHFILADQSGRALIDAGPESDGRLAAGQPITVQGRYRRGMVRAAFLVDASGHVEQVGPLGDHHGRPGPHGPGGPDGRDDPRGPGDDRPAPPPPPPPSSSSPAAAASSSPVTPPAPAAATRR
ncbi:MAG TPA: hypothetical protein VF649_08295 [Sphingomonas sp.]|jgi:hypothetical protein|uniref:hypothetical protein n=1 Tax=Sphingomonas sp. TaxID=28214 RepID=UPI002EDAD007